MKESKTGFLIAPSLSFGARLGLIGGLALAGAALQMFATVFVGWLLVLGAMLFTLVRGRRIEPDITGKGEWQNVTMDEFNLARKKLDETSKASRRSGIFNLKSCKGCGSCFTVAIVLFIMFVLNIDLLDKVADLAFGPVVRGGSLGFVFIVDALTFLVPLWLFGSISLWEPPSLRMKMEQLQEIANAAAKSPGTQMQPSLLVAKARDGQVPLDCRLTAKFQDSPADFMGVQVQVTINSVQGTNYPYTYCVLIAKPEFRLKDKAKLVIKNPPPGGWPTGWLSDENAKKESVFARFDDMIIEPHSEGGVDVVVVRQPTSGKGYTTSTFQAVKVFADAMSLAQAVLGK